MGSYLNDGLRGHGSEFQYDLRDPDDRFSDEEFERVREAVLEWSREEQVPVDVRKNERGFAVSIGHYVKNGDAFGMRLFLHLSAGIFRKLEAEAARATGPLSKV